MTGTSKLQLEVRLTASLVVRLIGMLLVFASQKIVKKKKRKCA